MSGHRDRDPFAELQAALDVEPSPGFEARTRARAASARRRRSMARWLAPAVATAAVATLVVIAPWRSEPELVAIVETTLGAPEVATFVPPVRTPPSPVAPARTPSHSIAPPRTPSAPVQPDLEMVTSQPDILRRLWASPTRWEIAEAEPALEPQAAASPAVAAFDMTVPPIIVAPIVVDPMTVARGGGELPIQRHAVAPDATRSQ